MSATAQVHLIRHAETEWTLNGRHTGRSDIPLTDHGRQAARGLGERLAGCDFALVLCSPSARARETCALAGLAEAAQIREDLMEWDYGDYEGLTTPEICERRPGWDMWRDGCPAGEGAEQVGARADHVVAELQGADGPAAVFSHGHILRVLGARWIELGPEQGARLALAPGAICRLGHEHEMQVLSAWNM
jgi:broad specificity phosphatase PhoE